VAKKGEEKIYLSLYMPVYFAFILQNCMLCLFARVVVVAFILQLFQVCVDVVMDITTS